MLFVRTAISMCILVCVVACGTLAPQGVVNAARLDPLNTPPEDLGLAVGVPDAIVLKDGDAMIRLAFSAGGAPLVDTRVPLSVAPAPAELQNRAAAGEQIYAASLAPQNATALAAAQADIRTFRSSGTEGEGTLSIAVVGGCRRGPPLEALPVTTWLRTDPSAPFVPLTRRMDVLDELRAAGATLRPCAG